MYHCIDSKLCNNQKDFCKSIGIIDTAIRTIRSGTRSFTTEQMVTACKKYKINMNWITGFSSEMKSVKSKSALQNLKDAVRVVESELT